MKQNINGTALREALLEQADEWQDTAEDFKAKGCQTEWSLSRMVSRTLQSVATVVEKMQAGEDA